MRILISKPFGEGYYRPEIHRKYAVGKDLAHQGVFLIIVR